MRIVIAPFVACLTACLGACANSAYDKARSDADAWETAKAECSAKAAQVVPNPLQHIMARHVYDECLGARGWRRSEGMPYRHYRR